MLLTGRLRAPQQKRDPLGNTRQQVHTGVATRTYEELLAAQQAMNKQTLSALRSHGLTPESEVRLDFTYLAPSAAAAEALAAFLTQETDYEAAARRSGGLLARSWGVTGKTQPTAISESILDEWVDWMITAGLERGCTFDGWGTSV